MSLLASLTATIFTRTYFEELKKNPGKTSQCVFRNDFNPLWFNKDNNMYSQHCIWSSRMGPLMSGQLITSTAVTLC